MSSEEWVEDDEPKNFLDKIVRVLFPKKKKKPKKEVAPTVVEKPQVSDLEKELQVASVEEEEPQIKPVEEKVSDGKHNKKNKKEKKPLGDDDWKSDTKREKIIRTPDVSRGLPGNLMVKRGVATILFFIYILLLIYVVRFELFSTIICIASAIIVLDYLAITRGGEERWGQ